MEDVICFKHNVSLNISEALLPKSAEVGFTSEQNVFYIVKQINLLSNKFLNDDEADLTTEYKRVTKQMQEIIKTFQDLGAEQISYSDYKKAENKIKENNTNNIIQNLSENEKFVYEKTKDFFAEYDIRNPSQRYFITSLRSRIASGENINEEILDQYAQSLNKNLDDVLDFALQGIVCDFISIVQKNLKEKNIKSIKNKR